MESEAGRALPDETGGVLLGWVSVDDRIVTHVVGPGPAAHHDPDRFEPDYPWQENQIARLYESSGRKLAYLGDWHTHPGGSAAPSATDTRTLRKIADYPEARCPDPLMIILTAPVDGRWAVSAFANASVLLPFRSRSRRVTYLGVFPAER